MKLVIFDVDGTLVDSQAHILAAMEAACAAIGVPMPSREAALGVVGLSLPLAIGVLAPEASEDEIDQMVAIYKDAFQQMRLSGEGASPLFPGTREMLDRLARHDDLLLGVATGKSRQGLDHLMDMHGLSPYFVTTQVADQHPSKPHPSMIEAALSETGVKAQNAAMIGDTSFDVEMGQAAGVHTIGVCWGYHDVSRLKTKRLINDWDELDPILEGLWCAV